MNGSGSACECCNPGAGTTGSGACAGAATGGGNESPDTSLRNEAIKNIAEIRCVYLNFTSNFRPPKTSEFTGIEGPRTVKRPTIIGSSFFIGTSHSLTRQIEQLSGDARTCSWSEQLQAPCGRGRCWHCRLLCCVSLVCAVPQESGQCNNVLYYFSSLFLSSLFPPSAGDASQQTDTVHLLRVTRADPVQIAYYGVMLTISHRRCNRLCWSKALCSIQVRYALRPFRFTPCTASRPHLDSRRADALSPIYDPRIHVALTDI